MIMISHLICGANGSIDVNFTPNTIVIRILSCRLKPAFFILFESDRNGKSPAGHHC